MPNLNTRPNLRAARVANIAPETLKRYLPGNYVFVLHDGDGGLIAGRDSAGWTLDDYVIPRLASGLYFATEVDLNDTERRLAERVLADAANSDLRAELRAERRSGEDERTLTQIAEELAAHDPATAARLLHIRDELAAVNGDYMRDGEDTSHLLGGDR